MTVGLEHARIDSNKFSLSGLALPLARRMGFGGSDPPRKVLIPALGRRSLGEIRMY